MTVAEIAAEIEAAAPIATAAEWDNVGLQVGHPQACVERLLVTLDVTADVLHEADVEEADLIISHHPVIFEPLRAVLAADPVGGLLKALLAADISLYVAHTNLDAAPQIGTTAALAGVLGLGDVGALIEEGGVAWGAIGVIEAPMPLGVFADRVGELLHCGSLGLVGAPDREVRTVAVMPGSGGDAVRPAAAAGADVLVCGDLKHHDALEAAALGLAVVDAGHYSTERPVVASLAKYLRGRCAGVQVLQSQVVTDPIIGTALRPPEMRRT